MEEEFLAQPEEKSVSLGTGELEQAARRGPWQFGLNKFFCGVGVFCILLSDPFFRSMSMWAGVSFAAGGIVILLAPKEAQPGGTLLWWLRASIGSGGVFLMIFGGAGLMVLFIAYLLLFLEWGIRHLWF